MYRLLRPIKCSPCSGTHCHIAMPAASQAPFLSSRTRAPPLAASGQKPQRGGSSMHAAAIWCLLGWNSTNFQRVDGTKPPPCPLLEDEPPRPLSRVTTPVEVLPGSTAAGSSATWRPLPLHTCSVISCGTSLPKGSAHSVPRQPSESSGGCSPAGRQTGGGQHQAHGAQLQALVYWLMRSRSVR